MKETIGLELLIDLLPQARIEQESGLRVLNQNRHLAGAAVFEPRPAPTMNASNVPRDSPVFRTENATQVAAAPAAM